MNNYERLVWALNGYFEFAEAVRFERLWLALEDSMEELGIEPFGWKDGYRLRQEYQERAEKKRAVSDG
jgi:hypothetical protein